MKELWNFCITFIMVSQLFYFFRVELVFDNFFNRYEISFKFSVFWYPSSFTGSLILVIRLLNSLYPSIYNGPYAKVYRCWWEFKPSWIHQTSVCKSSLSKKAKKIKQSKKGPKVQRSRTHVKNLNLTSKSMTFYNREKKGNVHIV
jgi:hypothetical protein